MSLARVPLRTPVMVKGVKPGHPSSYRLMEMGLINGAVAEVLGRAPLGDPLHIRVNDYSLSLRSCEAELIEISA